MTEQPYDSAPDTQAHINRVQEILAGIRSDLKERGEKHDQSKLSPEEKDIFDVFTPKLRDSEYGSEEYKGYLAEMKVALDHHYAENRHHPEHHPNGIMDMTLMDLIEMVADWKAAGERHATGNIWKSLAINAQRFNIPPSIRLLLINTVKALWPEIEPPEPETDEQARAIRQYHGRDRENGPRPNCQQ